MAVILPDGSVYTQDGGVWRHVPDVATANAMGVDWNALDAEDSLPGPQGDDWPSVDAGGGAAASSSSSSGGGGGGVQAVSGRPVLLPDGSVYSQDPSSGAWRHIPDVATANAMGLDWNNLDREDAVPGAIGPDWPAFSAASSSSSGGGGFGGGDLSGILPDDLSEEGTFNSVMLAYGAEEAEGRVVLPAAAWANLRDQLVHDIPYVGNHVRARGRGLAAPVASRLWARGT